MKNCEDREDGLNFKEEKEKEKKAQRHELILSRENLILSLF